MLSCSSGGTVVLSDERPITLQAEGILITKGGTLQVSAGLVGFMLPLTSLVHQGKGTKYPR